MNYNKVMREAAEKRKLPWPANKEAKIFFKGFVKSYNHALLMAQGKRKKNNIRDLLKESERWVNSDD